MLVIDAIVWSKTSTAPPCRRGTIAASSFAAVDKNGAAARTSNASAATNATLAAVAGAAPSASAQAAC